MIFSPFYLSRYFFTQIDLDAACVHTFILVLYFMYVYLSADRYCPQALRWEAAMALKQKREQTIFQKQLEKAATRNIVFLVFIGCLFFSAAIFGINYLNTRFNVQEHIEFLTSTFQTRCV